MSYTEIYKFTKTGRIMKLGEVNNAWRGAMAIWNILDKKYLPPFIPEWAKRLDKSLDAEYSRAADFSGQAIKEVWQLATNPKVSEVDKIVLKTTFDNVVVMKEDLPKIVRAFRRFEGNTSLKEQADIIEKAFQSDRHLMAIAWNQTSVNADTWSKYNLLKGDKHWNLFDESKPIPRAEVFKDTDDEWYPCYPNNQVKLTFHGQISDGTYRVSAWGNDDFGIDKDFETEIEAFNVFQDLESQQKINHKDLYDLGFKRF